MLLKNIFLQFLDHRCVHILAILMHKNPMSTDAMYFLVTTVLGFRLGRTLAYNVQKQYNEDKTEQAAE
jgi:hypothetical protein